MISFCFALFIKSKSSCDRFALTLAERFKSATLSMSSKLKLDCLDIESYCYALAFTALLKFRSLSESGTEEFYDIILLN